MIRDIAIGLVSGIGGLALVGHVMELPVLTTWGGSAVMRVVTAVWMVLLALALTLRCRQAWLAWLGGLCFVVLFGPVLAWQVMSHGTAFTCWGLGGAAALRAKPAAWTTMALPVMALVGHALDVPVLYWSSDPMMSYGMAIPTAVALVLACGVVATESEHG